MQIKGFNRNLSMTNENVIRRLILISLGKLETYY